MSAFELSRPVSRAGRPQRPNAARRANPPGRRAAPHHWPDEDITRELRAQAAEDERDHAQWEAEREEPATEDGGWDG